MLPSIREQLDSLEVPPFGASSGTLGVTEKTSLRAMQGLIPFATKEDMRSYGVKAWLIYVMPKLQEAGYNFHNAFKKAAQLWNASSYSSQNGFRLPFEWSETKGRGKRKGGTVINPFHIRKILEISDTKQETVAQSLGLDIREIWPKVILGRNQFRNK